MSHVLQRHWGQNLFSLLSIPTVKTPPSPHQCCALGTRTTVVHSRSKCCAWRQTTSAQMHYVLLEWQSLQYCQLNNSLFYSRMIVSLVQRASASYLLANSPIYFCCYWYYSPGRNNWHHITSLYPSHMKCPKWADWMSQCLTDVVLFPVMWVFFPAQKVAFYVCMIFCLFIYWWIPLELHSFELCAGWWAIGLSLKGTSGQHQGQLGRNQTIGPHRLPISFPRGNFLVEALCLLRDLFWSQVLSARSTLPAPFWT